jgi:hypothetical protein
VKFTGFCNQRWIQSPEEIGKRIQPHSPQDLSSRSQAQEWRSGAIRQAPSTCLMDLPHRLQMENEASVSAATSCSASLGCCQLCLIASPPRVGRLSRITPTLPRFALSEASLTTLALFVAAAPGSESRITVCQLPPVSNNDNCLCRHVSGFRSQLLKMTDNAIRRATAVTAVDGLILRLFYGALLLRSAFARSLMRLLSDARLSRMSGLVLLTEAKQFLRLPSRP